MFTIAPIDAHVLRFYVLRMASSALGRSVQRRPANISLDAALIAEARALGVNISRACERGLADRVAEARKAQWLVENAAALSASNAHVEQHGLPLAASRLF